VQALVRPGAELYYTLEEFKLAQETFPPPKGVEHTHDEIEALLPRRRARRDARLPAIESCAVVGCVTSCVCRLLMLRMLTWSYLLLRTLS